MWFWLTIVCVLNKEDEGEINAPKLKQVCGSCGGLPVGSLQSAGTKEWLYIWPIQHKQNY